MGQWGGDGSVGGAEGDEVDGAEAGGARREVGRGESACGNVCQRQDRERDEQLSSHSGRGW